MIIDSKTGKYKIYKYKTPNLSAYPMFKFNPQETNFNIDNNIKYHYWLFYSNTKERMPLRYGLNYPHLKITESKAKIVKLRNSDMKQISFFEFNDDVFVPAFQFVPRNDNEEEGYLLCQIGTLSETELWFFDTQKLYIGAVCKIKLNKKMNVGLHSTFMVNKLKCWDKNICIPQNLTNNDYSLYFDTKEKLDYYNNKILPHYIKNTKINK